MSNHWQVILDRFRGKTYRSVLLPPLGKNLAESRNQVSLDTWFSSNVRMRQPLVSANMLDVTESKMAIAQALNGGLGVIHRFCSIDRQSREISDTKRAHNFLIENPYKIAPTVTIGTARKTMNTRGVGSLLVCNTHNVLLGLLTQRDVRFVEETETVGNHMTSRSDRILNGKNLVVARPEDVSSIERVMGLFKLHKVKKLPVVDKDHHIVGLISAKDIERLQKYPNANLNTNSNLVVGAAIGAVGDYIERAQEMIKAKADVLVMDVTSAHSISVERALKRLRQTIGNYELVVGNIGTSEQAHFLIKEGVQGLKIGVGPGGPCTTRLATGIGVSQLFAILEIGYNLKFKYNLDPKDIPPLCADGNIRSGCDVVHALIAGASSVMMGTLFAGTEETPGEPYPKADGMYKRYAGMASFEAAIERYTAMGSENPVAEALQKAPEGMPREVKVQGSVETVIHNILGGVRSGISHRGVLSLTKLQKQNPLDIETGFQILDRPSQEESYKRS